MVDRKGQIRGYIDGRKEENVYRLEQKVRGLLEPEVVLETRQASSCRPSNASLNGTCGLLLILGYVAIRNRWVTFHKVCMLTALAKVSVIFLGCYLRITTLSCQQRHADELHRRGLGAAAVFWHSGVAYHIWPPWMARMAVLTTYRGLCAAPSPRHTRLARWTYAAHLALYVCPRPGVVVYVMLYQLFQRH